MQDVLTQRSLSTVRYKVSTRYKVLVPHSWQRPSGRNAVLHHMLNYCYVCCSKITFAVYKRSCMHFNYIHDSIDVYNYNFMQLI